MPGEQRIVHFSGSVQGVGFRYTACRVARGYSVAGYVRNLPDGRVECLLEGAPEQIDAFLAELRRELSGYVKNQTQQTAPLSGRYDSFTVKF